MQSKKSLAAVAAYAPGRPVDEIKRCLGLSQVVKLASNENPLGASPAAVEAMRRCAEDIFMYPDPGAFSLRAALSEKLPCQPENLIFGTGSDGLIELVCKTFLEKGDESIVPSPSFSLYELNIRAAEAAPVVLPLDNTLHYSPKSMLAYVMPKTKVIWLCNPNNPTGGIYTEQEQLDFLAGLPENILVVIDEAYYEYACENPQFPNSLSLLKEHKNVLILRTFSKIYGLAGLRVGYGIGHPDIIAQMEKVRPPFNVCSPALAAAEAALADRAFVERSLAANRKGKAFLEKAFTEMGLSFVESSTNFIAVNIGRDSKTVYERLLKEGYIVKGGHVLGMPGYLRVSVGTLTECQGFVKALARVLQD